LPPPQPHPADLGQFPRHRYPGPVAAAAFADPLVEVRQPRVAPHQFDGRLYEHPSQPPRPLLGDAAVVIVPAGLVDPRRQACVGPHLAVVAEAVRLSEFCHDEQRRVPPLLLQLRLADPGDAKDDQRR